MTITEINQAIMVGNLTNDQLDSVLMAIKYARGQISRTNRFTLTIGKEVKFRNSKLNMMTFGTVQKINHKNVVVRVGNTTWRVPANMIEAA